MYDNLNKTNKKALILIVFLTVLGAAIYTIIYFNLFGFSDFLEDGDIKPARLYGGIFCAFIGIVPLLGLPRILVNTPMKSLEKYAQKTENPKATMMALLDAWEKGYQLRPWCRMDEEYLITFVNGANANVVHIKDVVWAYKTTTRMYFVKTNTSLYVHYANRKIQAVPLGDAVIDYILQEFMKKHRDIAVGSNSDVEKLYFRKKDMNGLKEYARQQRMGIH